MLQQMKAWTKHRGLNHKIAGKQQNGLPLQPLRLA